VMTGMGRAASRVRAAAMASGAEGTAGISCAIQCKATRATRLLD
jgi:hypothetical protein